MLSIEAGRSSDEDLQLQTSVAMLSLVMLTTRQQHACLDDVGWLSQEATI